MGCRRRMEALGAEVTSLFESVSRWCVHQSPVICEASQGWVCCKVTRDSSSCSSPIPSLPFRYCCTPKHPPPACCWLSCPKSSSDSRREPKPPLSPSSSPEYPKGSSLSLPRSRVTLHTLARHLPHSASPKEEGSRGGKSRFHLAQQEARGDARLPT